MPISKSAQFHGSPIHYVHGKQASLRSQFIQVATGLSGAKNLIEKKLRRGDFQPNPDPIPRSLQASSCITEATVLNRRVWTITPRHGASGKVVLVIHGGAHFGNLSKYTWGLTKELQQLTGATFVVPDYPLAPEANYQHVHQSIYAVYQQLLAQHSPEDIVVMGDSSGGGVALAFAMRLRDEDVPQPDQLIMLAPWLDQTLTNPDIAAVDKKDTILGIEGLRIAGQLHAGELDLQDYRVSPIYGDLSGLPKMSVFIGTNDLFVADVRKLMSKANQSGVAINYYEYPRMFHIWLLAAQLPEARHGIGQIAGLIIGVTPKIPQGEFRGQDYQFPHERIR